MNGERSMLLIGIGTAGSAIARGVSRAFGEGLRFFFADTDASVGQGEDAFVLLGGDRLSGRGTGGDFVAGRLAADDSIKLIDERLDGVRLTVIVTALGGGTGGGATLEIVKHLADRGIATIVFATTPFVFEGEDRQRNARGVMSMIEESAGATFFLPLDKLVDTTDNMNDAMRRAIDTVASGVTLFWRLVEKPGYIHLDSERLRHILSGVGRGRFATVSVQGPGRAAAALDQLARSRLLSAASGPVRSCLCGILAGDDLLLSEVGQIAEGIRKNFGGTSFDLGTVNDEGTFSGRLSVVVMLFEAGEKAELHDEPKPVIAMRRHRPKGGPLSTGPTGRGRFNKSEPTIWNGEDLDIPTFIRKNLNLDI